MPSRAFLKNIEAQILELRAKADALKNAEEPGVKQLREVLTKFKLTGADVSVALGSRSSDRLSTLRGQKVKPKYRNPANRQET